MIDMANENELEDQIEELEDQIDDIKDEGEEDTSSKKEALKPEDGIEELRRQLASETEARKRSEALLSQEVQVNARLRSEAQNSDLQTITSAIEVVRSNQNNAKTALKKALADGDVDAIADLQEEIAVNSVRIAQLESGKESIEAQAKNPPHQQTPVNDPVEALASQLSSRSAAWVRNHPEFAKDSRKYQAMIGAHNVAIGQGKAVDTDEYFTEIERVLGVTTTSKDEDNVDDDPTRDAAKTVQRRSSPSPAPVSRTTTTTPEERKNTIRLSAAEREMASNMGMTEEEYAKNKRELVRQGRIN